MAFQAVLKSHFLESQAGLVNRMSVLGNAGLAALCCLISLFPRIPEGPKGHVFCVCVHSSVVPCMSLGGRDLTP